MERDYNQIKRLTSKMEEAREKVDDFIKERKHPPSYNIIARKLKIDHSTAYYRLRGYRDKMKRK